MNPIFCILPGISSFLLSSKATPLIIIKNNRRNKHALAQPFVYQYVIQTIVFTIGIIIALKSKELRPS